MKKLYDKDLGIDCDFVATGNSNEEVIRNATKHIKEVHPDEMKRVKGMMESKIQG